MVVILSEHRQYSLTLNCVSLSHHFYSILRHTLLIILLDEMDFVLSERFLQ